MSLFGRESVIKWNGEEYNLIITMETVDKFESGPLSPNILECGITLGNSAPRMSIVATAYKRLLDVCGINVPREDVYGALMAELVSGKREMLDCCVRAVDLMIPKLESDERVEHSKKK